MLVTSDQTTLRGRGRKANAIMDENSKAHMLDRGSGAQVKLEPKWILRVAVSYLFNGPEWVVSEA